MQRTGRLNRTIGLAAVAVTLLLSSCEGFQNSVQAYPVHVVIDTHLGPFVHFQPTNLNSYIIANREGFFLNGQYVLPAVVTDRYGYGGVLVFVSINGYDAYDLACPYCAGRGQRQPCEIDGMFAVCPHCGEQYELSSGTAVPQKGLAKEPMRRLRVLASDGKLTISQFQ